MGRVLGHNHREAWVQVLTQEQEQRRGEGGAPLRHLTGRTREKAEGIAGPMAQVRGQSGAGRHAEGGLERS